MIRCLPALLVLALSGCGGSPKAEPTPTSLFAGQWAGSWNKQLCSDFSGSSFCPSAGSGGPLTLVLNQSGATLQGTVSVGSYHAAVSGSVPAAMQQLRLMGSGSSPAGSLSFNEWNSTLSGATMTGGVLFSISPVGQSGNALVLAELTLTQR